MIDRDYIPEDDIFFTFDTNKQRYQIISITEDKPMYGVITNIKDNEQEILDITIWASKFVETLGDESVFDINEIEIQIIKDEDTRIFTEPFYLEISKGCNLTYISNSI